MTKTPIDAKRGEYRFKISDGEAICRIYECLAKTNPELAKGDIWRDENAREYKAEYRKRNGETVRMSIGTNNLKRYFGAFILSFERGGLSFVRRTAKPQNT